MYDTNRRVGNTRPNAPATRIGSTPGQWNPESGSRPDTSTSVTPPRRKPKAS
ncbi:hypothetical protein [Streptomyces sp. NPDC047973]|uniref:hypothetical protein n=1 Tax=Streptomyces sp. NPDC047973 TaxID=3155383 RepID=UPI003444CB97